MTFIEWLVVIEWSSAIGLILSIVYDGFIK